MSGFSVDPGICSDKVGIKVEDGVMSAKNDFSENKSVDLSLATVEFQGFLPEEVAYILLIPAEASESDINNVNEGNSFRLSETEERQTDLGIQSEDTAPVVEDRRECVVSNADISSSVEYEEQKEVALKDQKEMAQVSPNSSSVVLFDDAANNDVDKSFGIALNHRHKRKCVNSVKSGPQKQRRTRKSKRVKTMFKCNRCEKTYSSSAAFKLHVLTHTLPFRCKVCGKAFSRRWLLEGHMRTHTGLRPFSCPLCNRAFSDRSNMVTHIRNHSEEKKLACLECGKSFVKMYLLIKHLDGGCHGSTAVHTNDSTNRQSISRLVS